MTGPTSNSPLNLGRYSIRPPELSSDLRVGAFYKRKQTLIAEDLACTPPMDSISKRLRNSTAASGISSGYKSRLRGSVRSTSRSTSRGSGSSLTTGKLVIATLAHTDFNNNDSFICVTDKSTSPTRPDYSERNSNIEDSSQDTEIVDGQDETQIVDGQDDTQVVDDQSHDLVIDTRQSSKFTEDTRGTSESFVIELNPEAFDSTNSDTTISSIRQSEELDVHSLRTPNEPRGQKRIKTYPKQLPNNKIMSGVVYVMSGIFNPKRSKLKDMAREMGAKYQAKWNRSCTHIICGFKNTPRYREARAENGRIVTDQWILKCFEEKQLLDWRNYKLGKYPYPDSEEEEVSDLD